MSDHGATLALDLYDLYTVAKDDLPSVAAIYGDVVARYASVRSTVDGAMTRPDHFGDTLGPVHTAWTHLHDIAATFMKDTERNLDETAATLTEAVKLYEATDHAARDRFNQLLNERGEPTPGK
ncbi:MAG TPA: type VII secretion target [Actinophytocola sp.]|uniref:type VII secretion target n=1 Tax=Actinophytocola sp. TaxID=1872138 RepID=UPI002E008839|nr:type VII secretion target [Actinophytocola sp.]